jgi:uncharacterized Zn finger protein (UPF0148 family)
MINGVGTADLPKTMLGKIDESKLSKAEEKQLKKTGQLECETCKKRKYKDGSDDPGVSYKSASHISTAQSASKVMSHEMEHYRRETSQAEQNDEKITSISVSTSMAICPECGKRYTSGGETRVTKRKDVQKESENNYFKNKTFDENIGKYFGKNVDVAL